MKEWKFRHIFAVLLIVVCSVLCGIKLWQRQAHLKKYEEMPETKAAAVVTETAPPETETETEPEPVRDPDAERVIDFAALQERNEDVVAWLYIPGTVVNYPVLWRDGDNEYYLRRDIDKVSGSYDGIFLDGSDKRDFSCLQNLIYGHHMKNGTMLTAICDFKNEEFFKEHRKAYLYTPDHTYILRTMACLYTDAGAEKRRTLFTDRLEFNAYVDQMTKGCSFRELPEKGIDRLFALVTCSYEFNDARTILYCYETDVEGNPVPVSEYPVKEKTGEESEDKSSDKSADKSADKSSDKSAK